ncbi:hypothetical protein BDW74DRAFT_182172 [Aspergillus multicolor]|uniref:uncharacterized protein n=1 Tax=Aspergillus multicolor TaxID=41759 RepID=UPI003CCDE61E
MDGMEDMPESLPLEDTSTLTSSSPCIFGINTKPLDHVPQTQTHQPRLDTQTDHKTPLHNTTPNPQPKSPFFTLPIELRSLIYNHIFTFAQPIHIAYVGGRGRSRSRKFRSFLCKLPESKQVERTAQGELCWKCVIFHEDCSARVYNGSHVNGVASFKVRPLRAERMEARVGVMLRCCWRVYSKTIHTLYSKNTFYMLVEMSTRMPSFHLSLIRTLTFETPPFHYSRGFDWYSEENLARWEAVINALGKDKFAGLTDLCFIMRSRQKLDGKEREYILRPVREAEGSGHSSVKPRFIYKGFRREGG